MPTLFSGLVAFTQTPVDAAGVVGVDALSILVHRMTVAKVDAIGLLGGTGTYAYLNGAERKRALAAALDAVGKRVPVIVGIGACRTSWAQELAADAERAWAAGLLMAPMSYTLLTQSEAAHHYRTVAGTTGLPLCVYDNPGTTHFAFSDDLIADFAATLSIAAIKMPLPADEEVPTQVTRLRARVPTGFSIGYSNDWGAAEALLAGADAWYSVVVGLLPTPALALTRASEAGDTTTVRCLDDAFRPMWDLFKAHGSLRVMYKIADRLSLSRGEPPLPLGRIEAPVAAAVDDALTGLTEAAG